MPLYEYECSRCGLIYTVRQDMFFEEKSEPCPKCKTMNRKIGNIASGGYKGYSSKEDK